ncbi:MAG: DUF1269 domain-containing protein [Deltaproteobacteria bacterium]|nr:MAG: DUF1269 domain-containing protein [Deltaproteobacteria bacterium]
MSDLIVIEFKDEESAFEARAELAKMQKEYFLQMEDVVVVTKNEKGKIKLHQAVNLTSAGAAQGGFWGMLIGFLLLNPLLGAAVGAGAGALSGKLSDIGINDQFMKDLAADLTEGTSALFILLRKVTPDKVLARLEEKQIKGKILKTSLTVENEDELRKIIEG